MLESKINGTARASQSFSKKEVLFLAEMFKLASRGADVSVLMRSPEARTVQKRIHAMKVQVSRGT